ncbi:hypothetical protein BH09BAC5_BH09BAC5_18080 [soil metagenome]
MKHFLPLACLCFLSVFGNAQTIQNGGFEFWNNSTTDMLDYYPMNSNPQASQLGMPPNCNKVADPQQGSFAVQLTTETNGTDTVFGYFINGDPNSGAGGIPYNQHPITLTGFYKSNVPVGDTALVLILFKEAGTIVSFDAAIFTGVHSTYTPFTVSLTIPALANPDSIVFGATSSMAFNFNGIPGSMLQLDNVTFTGASSQPMLMNGSFENWTSLNTSKPLDWATGGDVIYQTTDAHSGSYALMMNTVSPQPSYVTPSYATNGTFPPQSGPVGGRPYSLMNDTLCGWYKFIPVGTDSATVWAQTSLLSSPVGGAYVGLPPASNYTFFSIPFSSGVAPDTLLIVFASSYNGTDFSNAGSVFKVDDIYLKSSLTGITPEISWNTFGKVSLYPNPSSVDCWMEWNSLTSDAVTMTVTDAEGRIVSESVTNGTGIHREHIDTSVLAKGSYIVTLLQNGNRVSRKLFVQ